MGFFEYPIVLEDAGRLKIALSDEVASIWFDSKFEALRWTSRKLRDEIIDEAFADDIRAQILDSDASDYSPMTQVILVVIGSQLEKKRHAARWN